MQFNRIRKLLIALCSTVLFFCSGIAVILGVTPVFAENANYLEVGADDFKLNTITITEGATIFTVEMTYIGKENALPQQTGRRPRYQTISASIIANDNKGMLLNYAYGNETAVDICFVFDVPTGQSVSEYVNAINKITFSKGLTLQANATYINNNPNGDKGIIAVEDIKFEKDGDGWKSVTSSQPADEPETEGNGEILLTGAMLAPVWNSIQKTLYIEVPTPFTASEDITYTATAVGIRVDGADYNGEIKFTQEKDTNILRCTLLNAEALSVGSGITVTLFDTLLQSQATGKISLTGSCSVYGYLDGVWLAEEQFEVIKIVGDTTTSERFVITQTQYALPSFTVENGQMALGWLYNDDLYKIGENIMLDRDNRVILLKTITVGYSLVGGASIRYGQQNDSGIRFTSVLTEESYENAKAYISGVGIILMPSDKLRDGVGFTYENYEGEYNGNAQQAYILKSNIDFNGTSIFKFYATVVRIRAQNYNRSYSARGYVNVSYKSGVTRVYTDNIEKRSVYQVASNILNANPSVKLEPWQKEILDGYVNGVANISYDELTGTVQNICVSNNPVIEKVQVCIDANGTINLLLKTTRTSFSAVTYNGKRVISSLQSYDSANGVLTVKFTAENLAK